MQDLKFYAIIVAGGSGKRMNSAIPKQFLEIAGKPVIMHTIEKFYYSFFKPEIIIVLANDDLKTWKELIQNHEFTIPHKIINGGKERFDSVKNALTEITDENAIVAIHDAVRPLISTTTIDNCFLKATEFGNAIAAVNSRDSVRKITAGRNTAIPREEVFLVQTPQVFKNYQLLKAYQQPYNSFFTDDASVVEKAGYQIFLVEADHFNFKITFKEDILLAETLIKANSNES